MLVHSLADCSEAGSSHGVQSFGPFVTRPGLRVIGKNKETISLEDRDSPVDERDLRSRQAAQIALGTFS